MIWNDHVPDPDNPAQPRQIDIAIRRDGRLTLVECRLHRNRQGVKWVEELVGRRASLQASEVIAVSNAGFTKGAIRKARRFGVVLRDLDALTDSEISAWGRTHKVFLYFYTFDELDVTLTLDKLEITAVEAQAIADAFRTSQDTAAICNAVVDKIDERQLLPKQILDLPQLFDYNLERPNFQLAGAAVSLIKAAGSVRLIEREIDCQAIRAYGAPETKGPSREVLVEQFVLGETGVVQHAEAASFLIDVTTLQMPPLSQLRFVRLKGDVETNMASFEILGIEKLLISSGPIKLSLVAAGWS